jgi:hypothetical protein
MRRLLRSPAASFLAFVALLGGAVGIAESARVEQAPPQAPATASVAVSVATLACPDVRADDRTPARVMAAAPPPAGAPPADAAGTARVLAGLAERSAQGAVVARPARAAAATADANGPYAVRATGVVAPGLAAVSTTRGSSGDLRGLDSAACVRPGTDFWFVGGGAVVGQRDVLLLANAERTPAELDLEIVGPEGPVTAPSARGITVAPGEVAKVQLDALAPGVRALAIHVLVRSGRVAAALRDVQVRGLDPRGVDHVPAAAAPARRVVVPGVPGGPGERLLHVVAPGDSDAIVEVRLLAAGGGFVPAGLDVVTAKAGAVTTVDLARYARGEVVAVQLTSDVPVSASVLARTGDPAKTGELAWTAASVPLEAPAVLADSGTAPGVTAALVLSTTGPAARVRLEPIGTGTGTVPPAREVTVPEEGTLTVPLAGADQPYAVRIVPPAGGSPVWAARVLTATAPGGPFVTVTPVEPAVTTVVVPEVVADVLVGVERGASP